MNLKTQSAYECIRLARNAQQHGDKRAARRYAEEAVRLAPEIEEAWLMLAAVASPRASVVYLERALKINPDSERAHKGMRWAVARLRSQPPVQRPRPPVLQVPLAPTARYERKPVPGAIATRRISAALIVLIVLCAALGVASLSGAITPAISAPLSIGFASIRGDAASGDAASGDAAAGNTDSGESPTPTLEGNPLDINQPTYTPTATETPTPTPTFTPSPTPTDTPTPTETWTPLPTDTPLPPPPTEEPPVPPVSGGGGRWIDVDLTYQMVYAYEGDTVVNSFLVSTGTWLTPTVTGQFHIWIKLRYTDMSGPDYYLPNVPYTMYFYEDYALHGTYWHSNFGTPMSHGCVNLSIPDAEWLFNFADEGTLVNVHY
jgi:lipoprotein-anchoring transpeptidase ErfK/SrfK